MTAASDSPKSALAIEPPAAGNPDEAPGTRLWLRRGVAANLSFVVVVLSMLEGAIIVAKAQRSSAPIEACRRSLPAILTTGGEAGPDTFLGAGLQTARAIIDRGEVHHFPEPLLNPYLSKAPGRVRVVGIDARSRPIYDLFKETNLPEELPPELAFRAAHGRVDAAGGDGAQRELLVAGCPDLARH